MLKITIKDNVLKPDYFEKGMIRMSKDGKFVIMIVECEDDGELKAITLRDGHDERKNYMIRYHLADWLEVCPIIVENPQLNL